MTVHGGDADSRYAGLLSRLLDQCGHADSAAFVRENTDRRRGPCPFCKSSDGFSADDQRGIWRCFSCHAGGGIRDLARELGCNWKSFAEDSGLKAETEDEGKRPKANASDLKAAWAAATVTPVPAPARDYAEWRMFPEAFESGLARVLLRGDGPHLPRSCSHLCMGDRIVVPLYRVDGEKPGAMVGLQARAIDFNQEPRVGGAGRTSRAVFANPTALRILRGEAEDIKDVLVLEGLTDFLCAATALPPEVAVMGIAGTGNAESAIGKWVRGRRVILAFDGDEAGRAATVAAAGRIHLWQGEGFVTRITPKMDVASLIRARGRSELQRLLATERRADPEVEEFIRDGEGRWPEPVP